MLMKRNNEAGFAHLAVVIAVAVLLLVGFAGYRVFTSKENSKLSSSGGSSTTTESASSEESCSSKPVLPLPIDIKRVESILYPGQVRGGNYKPHGGFRLAGTDNAVEVKLPLTSKLISGARYIEQGEVQYMFDFETDCKIRMRFDHLLELSEDMKAEADKLPAAKVDDSRTTNLEGKEFKAGTVIAIQIGFKKNANTGFDFGLYDYNQPNEISKNSAWAADPLHQYDNAKYGVCWFDYLSPSDEATVRGLPATDMNQGKTSDYCK